MEGLTRRKKKVRQVIERTAEEIKQHEVDTQRKQKIIRHRLPFITFPSDEKKTQLLNSLTLLQLKGLNKDADKSTTGTKKELIARLLQFGVATSPYAKSAVRSSPRKPNTPKIPDCYPKHVVEILLEVIGLPLNIAKDLNPCFKAALSRRIFSLLRTEDFMDVLYEFVCPYPGCQCQIQYTKLDFLAQNFDLYLECQNNHRICVSGICCMNPSPHCLGNGSKTCVFTHVDQQWLYGYCTRNDSNSKLLCLTCKVPKHICTKLTSRAHVQNCEELLKLKSVKPSNRRKKKIAVSTLLDLRSNTSSRQKRLRSQQKGGEQEGKIGSAEKNSISLLKITADKTPKMQDTATNTSFSPQFSLTKSKSHKTTSGDSKLSRRIGKKSKLPHGTKAKRSRKKCNVIESATFSSPVSLSSTNSEYYQSIFSDDQSNASMEYFGNSLSSSLDSGSGSTDELALLEKKNTRSSKQHGKLPPGTLNRMDFLLTDDDIYVHNEKSSSVDESYIDFQSAFSPVEEARERIGFIVDEMDDQHNMSQGSLQDLDLRLTETSEFSTSNYSRSPAGLFTSMEHFM
eukprot:g12556.t1